MREAKGWRVVISNGHALGALILSLKQQGWLYNFSVVNA